jgi:hypothetical protein
MKCAALTGISPDIIKDLRSGRPRTIELQSTHNIVTIAEVEPGPETHIFLTSVDLADLSPGDPGICAYVLATSITMKRMVELSARVQVKYCASSVVKQVFHKGMTSPTAVEVLKSSCYHAG